MKVLAKVGLILLVWIAIPTALGFAGYYFIGPNLGKNGWFGNVAQKIVPKDVLSKATQSASPVQTEQTAQSDPVEEKSKRFAEPEVEVSVSKSAKRQAEERPRRRSTRRTQAPKPAEPPVDPSHDPASNPSTPKTGGDGGGDQGGSGGVGTGGAEGHDG